MAVDDVDGLIGAQDLIDEMGLVPSMEIRDAQMNNARFYGLAGGKILQDAMMSSGFIC